MHKIVGPTLFSPAGVRNENMGACHPECCCQTLGHRSFARSCPKMDAFAHRQAWLL